MELRGEWRNTEITHFILHPGETVAYTTVMENVQEDVDATTLLYSSPDVASLNAEWINYGCGTPLLIAETGPRSPGSADSPPATHVPAGHTTSLMCPQGSEIRM